MRIQYLSDLHLESWAFTLKVRPDADVVVLAGDLATPAHSVRFEKLLAETMGKPTIVLMGNHDFYGRRMEEAKQERAVLCRRYPNVHLLDDGWVIINGVQFLGSTLWSDYQLPITVDGEYGPYPLLVDALVTAPDRGVPDFRKIAYQGRLLTPADTREMHRISRHFIDVRYQSPWPTVVCTHFLPSPLSIDTRYKDSLLNPYFASHCEDLMGGNVLAWIHGHTHHSCGYRVNGTLVACNPRGYKAGENQNFDSQAVIDIEA